MDKPSKRGRGRPKTDLAVPVVTLHDNEPTFTLNMPAWWYAMAHLEAEWRASGRWKHGALGDLARNFTATGKADGGKSPAAITKARADARYQEIVAREVAHWRQNAEYAAKNPARAEDHRSSVRASIEAAMGARAKSKSDR